jgi:hypothetical protein
MEVKMIEVFVPDPDDLAYARLKPEIDRRYPHGHFVAVEGGQIIADAPTFEELDGRLNATGKTSPDILVIQAGDDDPDCGWILNLLRQT